MQIYWLESHTDETGESICFTKRISQAAQCDKATAGKAGGLSVVTVNSLIHELLETGEVIQKQMLPSGGGRPALQYQYNGRYKMALTAYMYVQEGRERLFLEVQDLFQNMVASDAYEIADMDIDMLEHAISKWMKQYPTISVMVFGIPGTEHQGKLKVMDYAIFQSQELFARLRSTYQMPVLIENDINAALFGYCQRQNIRQECTAGLYFPKVSAGFRHSISAEIFIAARITW